MSIYIGRSASRLAALALLAGPLLSSALGHAAQANTNIVIQFVSAKPATVAKTTAAQQTHATAEQPQKEHPLVDTATGVTTGYYLGTASVNGSTVQQAISFSSASSSASYVPTVGLHLGTSYSLGAATCTQTINNALALPYLESCTVTVTFAPLYPGGHRDAILIYDTDGTTQLGGAFLYGIGEAPQLMIQPGVTTSVQLPNAPTLFGSTTDDAGTYYVYANNGVYTAKKDGTTALLASSFPRGYGLSIDGAGNLFDPGNGGDGSSGHELGNNDPVLSYSTEGIYSSSTQIAVFTYQYTHPGAVAAGNLGTYYDADGGGEATDSAGSGQSYPGLLVQPYGYVNYSNAGVTTTTTNPSDPVLSPPPPPEAPDGSAQPAGGDLPFVYSLNGGNFGVYAMTVDPYENVFMIGFNGLAVWCGWGNVTHASSTDTFYSPLGLSSAITGSTQGCGSQGNNLVQLNQTTGAQDAPIAVDAADTVYVSQNSGIQMFSLPDNYASAITSIGVAGGGNGVSIAPDGTVYAEGGGNTLNIIDRSQGSIDFGLNNGQTPNPYTMTLYNGGNQPLNLSSITTTGAGYSVQPTATNGCNSGSQLAAGTVCQLKVTFIQPNFGLSTGAVNITTNSLNQSSAVQTIALSAEVSGINVTASPNPLAFGSKSASSTLPITVTNTSVGSTAVGYGSAVNISALTSSNPTVFPVSEGTCPSTQQSGTANACQLIVTYYPTAGQSANATISWTETLPGDDSVNLSVQVTGTGILTTPVITWPPPAPIAYGTPLSGTQLNATASYSGSSVAGTFVYTPAAGTVLGAGAQPLSATFTPTNTALYASVTPTNTITVQPGSLSVNLASPSRAFATANPAFTYTLSGFVNNDTSSVVSGNPVISTTATLSSPAGTYPITGTKGTLSAANYGFTVVPGTLTVLGGATQTITFNQIPNTPLAIGHLTLTAHSTSGALGQPIVFSVTSGPASVAGKILTLTGTGTVKVTATQAANATFAAANPVSVTFMVF